MLAVVESVVSVESIAAVLLLTQVAAKPEAFSVAAFVEANIDNPELPGGIFWAGSLSYGNEPELSQKFELIQYGMVAKVRGDFALS